MLTKIDMKNKKVIDHNGEKITIIKRPKGLGDTVENLLHTGTIGKVVHKLTGKTEPCSKCNKRKNILNKVVPYNQGN